MGRGKRPASGPRLDDDGYLNEDPHGRACEVSSWNGSSTGSGTIPLQEPGADTIEYEVQYYESVNIGDKTIKLSDAVYLTPMEAGEACELGIVKALYAVDDEDVPKRCTVQWLWRPEAVNLGEGETEIQTGKRELFVSNTEDTHNSIDAIERCVSVPRRCATSHVCDTD